ncbi:MAG: YraN family protein [Paracoccaceae bacterium]
MPYDFVPPSDKTRAGQTAYFDGVAAEDSVCRDYLARGYSLIAQRWRGRCGEIDLIFKGRFEYVFVEVKKAKTLDLAATRLSDRQLWRIARSAEDYLANTLKDPFAMMRLDLAMADQQGDLRILEGLSLY